ncbi:tape measure protein [Methylosinus sp. LW4]|uniref:tape measure protein n=1 Tax=Methylosinus sp. LW4 TaxID=136993 RepID=UPI000A0123BF|nr:tape measure protein [Methylosinus sp. LW4]
MAAESHTITLAVDASQGRRELQSLTQSIRSATESLKLLNGSTTGGSAFSQMARNLSDTSRAFSELKRQTSGGSGLSNLSREISMLSRGMPVAAREIVALASTLMVSRNAVALFGGALGSVALADFAKSVSTTGNSLLSFKIGIDAVATSSKESSDALAFIRDAATRIGAPLDTATDAFKTLYVNMRSLGRPAEEIMKVFSGFQTAMTALHVSARDQALSWREIAETYSQGVIHTRQAILSLGSHVPGMAALLQESLGVNGGKLHEMFKNGGLPLETWTKAADILSQRYGAQLPEAFRHSQQQLVALSNEMEKLRQISFDSGFDSGLTTLLKSLRSAFGSIDGADSIGKAIGEGFRIAFVSASMLLDKIVQLKEPIVAIGGAILGWNVAVATIRLAAGAVALLFTPLGLAAAGAITLASSWDSLKSVFSGSDTDFNAGAEAIKRLTGGWIDLHGAIKGAIVAWEFAKDLLAGKGIDASRVLATQAGNAFDAGQYGKKSGTSFADSFVEGASTLFSKLDDLAGKHLPGRDLAKSLREEWTQLYKDSAPSDFHGGGDYASNAARYAKPDLSLSEALTKTFEKLQPTIAALKEYKTQLDSIAQMKGKLDPLGHIIDDAAVKRLKEAARSDAFESAFPMASKIQDHLDELKATADLLGNKSSKSDLQVEKEVLREVNALKRKGVEIRDDEVDALRAILSIEKELAKGGSNGLTQWANSQKSAIDAMNDNIKSGLDSLADGIAKVATEGKGKFKNLGEAIRSEFRDITKSIASNFLKAGIRDLMAQGIKGLNLDSSLSTSLTKAINGGQSIVDRANGKLDDALKNVAEANISAGVVNLTASGINGIGGTSGPDTFRPNGTNPLAAGGVEPKKSSNVAEQIGVKPLADSGALRMLDGVSKMSTRPGTDMIHVNAQLKDIIDNASKSLPEGWRAQFVSGFRHTGAINPNSLHDRGLATDVQLFDDKGKALPNYQNAGTFRDYEKFAQAAKRYQTDRYPELNDKFAWGGYYGGRGGRALGYGGADLMHFDLGGKRGRMGNWDDGLTAGRGLYDTTDKPSVGMRKLTEGRSAFDEESALERQMREQREREKANRSGPDSSSADIGRQSNSTANDLAGLGTSIAKLGASGKATAPAIVNVAESVLKLLSNLASSGGSGGGSGGLLSGAAGLIGGLFSEGGYSGSPVSTTSLPASFWAGAPRFAEGGTTLPGGGMPAVLHQNEAVVPLSRGREIPVDIRGGGDGGDTHIHNTVKMNITPKDADSFRRSHGQIASAWHKEAARLHARNN